MYTTIDLATRLGLSPQTLRRWRMWGHGPRYHRLGGPRSRALYRQEEVERWLAEREAGSTSEEAARAQVAAAAGQG